MKMSIYFDSFCYQLYNENKPKEIGVMVGVVFMPYGYQAVIGDPVINAEICRKNAIFENPELAMLEAYETIQYIEERYGSQLVLNAERAMDYEADKIRIKVLQGELSGNSLEQPFYVQIVRKEVADDVEFSVPSISEDQLSEEQFQMVKGINELFKDIENDDHESCTMPIV